ncbi:RluA family pseudouridine synthase [Phenylobacterium parvum]|uniref:Pseudouridine synthase n=1 Tax=Phenylobacterium parvum TaxID=2201350 RepID=A0A2Z3HPP6_9CAUL|nr:RluA family pseudouridine synthase [Phenylobacterium parvum]AWM78343.1 RluA family pseudouridine synthase [Phenylobacterium parvum]
MPAAHPPAGFEDDGPDDSQEAAPAGEFLEAILAAGVAGRLDRALADALPQLSRARLRALMETDAVTRDGAVVRDASGRAAPGIYRVEVPPPAAALPEPQDLPLDVLFEDAHLIVLNKAAGMAVHPGPGVPDGTLVNALLHHCGASLSGIGGVARPGIVHRLDKETSGVMVAAKTDAAHQGLAALFAAHDIDRSYIALVRGAPRPPGGEIRTRIGRSTHDRMKMAVLKAGGREAVTHYRTERTFGPPGAPLAARVACRLETGRTHQIRVHMASLGCPCLGDPVYGSGAPAAAVREALKAAGLSRQALHAAVLGFLHPVTGERLRFEAPPPPDMAGVEARLSEL